MTRRDRRGHGERRTGTRGGTRNTMVHGFPPSTSLLLPHPACSMGTAPPWGQWHRPRPCHFPLCHGKHGEVAVHSGHLHCLLLWLTLDKRWSPPAAWKSVFLPLISSLPWKVIITNKQMQQPAYISIALSSYKHLLYLIQPC